MSQERLNSQEDNRQQNTFTEYVIRRCRQNRIVPSSKLIPSFDSRKSADEWIRITILAVHLARRNLMKK